MGAVERMEAGKVEQRDDVGCGKGVRAGTGSTWEVGGVGQRDAEVDSTC